MTTPPGKPAPQTRRTPPVPPPPPKIGVRIAGTGSYLPDRKLTNADLAGMMDTTDEWIVQRTGIHERRIVEPGTTITPIAAEALRRAPADAKIAAADLDLIK